MGCTPGTKFEIDFMPSAVLTIEMRFTMTDSISSLYNGLFWDS